MIRKFVNGRFVVVMNKADDGTGSSGSGGGGTEESSEEGEGEGSGEKQGGETGSAGGDKDKKSLSDTEAKLLRESMQRKERLKEVETENQRLKSVVTELEQLGGLDALRQIIQERRDQETRQLEEKGEYERVKARMREEHQAAIETERQRAAQKERELAQAISRINELTIGSAFAQSRFVQETTYTPSKARVIYGDHFELKDDQIVAYDKPKSAANRTPLVDASGNPLSFDEALKRIVDADPERDTVLKAKINPGAGSTSRQAATRQEKTEQGSLGKISSGLKGLGVSLNTPLDFKK